MRFLLFSALLLVGQGPNPPLRFEATSEGRQVVARLPGELAGKLPAGKLTQEQGETVLTLVLLADNTKTPGPTMLGKYERNGNSLTFMPRFPLSAGAIRLNGEDIGGLKPFEINRRGLSRSFQITNIFHNLSVFENLRHHGYLYGLSGRDLARGIDRSLERLGLMPHASTRVSRLTIDVRRRVELAKAIVPEPQLLVIDEPGRPAARSLGAGEVVVLGQRPPPVLVAVDEPLEGMALEQDELSRGGRPSLSGTPSEPQQQLGLFQPPAADDRLRAAIDAVDIERMTPLEALSFLAELKKQG